VAWATTSSMAGARWQRFPRIACASTTGKIALEEQMLGSTAGGSTDIATTPRPEMAEESRLKQIVSHDFTSAVLAYGITVGFFILIFLLLAVSWAGSPAAPSAGAATVSTGPFHDLLNTLIGIVGTAWATIVAFYFGSSTGSRQQLQTLSQVALQPSYGTGATGPGPTGPGSTGATGPGPTGATGPTGTV
jgi:hypothetical protein